MSKQQPTYTMPEALNALPIGVSMGADSIVIKISLKDWTDDDTNSLDNFRVLHKEIHQALRDATQDFYSPNGNPVKDYPLYLTALLPSLLPTGIDYSPAKTQEA